MKITNQDLAFLPCINNGRNSLIYRQDQSTYGKPVAVKVLRHVSAAPREVAQFENEYQVSHGLQVVGTRRALENTTIDGRAVLILEYVDGITLDAVFSEPRPLVQALSIAISIASTLLEIHRRGIVHKNITSTNILVTLPQLTTTLIDFGMATQTGLQATDPENLELFEGSLAFISPEQTGRMDRAVDYRTDLYSLGVALYQMFAGKLPFEATDASELVHCHIARNPVPVCEINPEIPTVVSDIVMKLMAKNPHDRYHSAYGLKSDLQNCLNQIKQTGAIQTFGLAQNDPSSLFEIPQKLYGRDPEFKILSQAFEKAAQGAGEVVLISGNAGVGKSALVKHLQKLVVERGGYFIAGKHDENQRNVPYDALIQAFTNLVDLILMTSAEELADWKARITQALGNRAALVIEVIPRLELVIGKQPFVQKLEPTETQNRFQHVIQSFVKAIAQKQHPLVLFIDNLQWMDSASLDLLKSLMAGIGNHHWLFIGVYRDNEPDAGHSLVAMVKLLKRQNVTARIIHLDVLSCDVLNELVSDTLTCESSHAQSLTDLVYEKTGGNALFATEFLQSLHKEGLLLYDSENQRWAWDTELIQKRDITGNVVTLMTQEIAQLPKKTQELLSLAACIGNSFDLKTLAAIADQSPQVTFEHLRKAIKEHLILPMDKSNRQMTFSVEPKTTVERRFEFPHDQVRLAACSFVSKKQRKVTRLQVGRLRLQNTPDSELEEKIFDIVDHFNEGFQYIQAESEKHRLVELNLIAGRKAKRAAAYQAAIWYFSMGIGMLPADKWECDYELAFNLYMEAVEAEYLSTNFERAEMLSAEILQHVQDIFAKVRVHQVRIRFYTAQNQNLEAIKAGLEALDLLDVFLPAEPKEIQTATEALSAELTQVISSIQALSDLPVMQDERQLAIMHVLMDLVTPAHQMNHAVLPLIIFKMALMSVRHGNSPMAAFAYGWYGVLLCGTGDDIEKGYQFGQLSLQVLRQFDAPGLDAKINFLFNVFVRHWKEHLRETINPLQAVYQSGVETGELEYTYYSALYYCSHLLFTGSPLEFIRQRQTEYLEMIDRYRLEPHIYLGRIVGQMVLNLLGNSADPCELSGELFDESQMLPIWIEQNNSMLVFSVLCCRTMLQYWFGCYTNALESAQMAEEYEKGGEGYACLAQLKYYHALALLAHYPNAAPEIQQEHLAKIKTLQERMKHWANHAPMNYQHKYDLIEAETARVTGDIVRAMEFFNRAIKGARENGYVHEEALAHEREAELYISLGREEFAGLDVAQACNVYRTWGATRQVQDLEKRYKGLTPKEKPASLDTAAILKASHMISQEIRLEQLLDKLMHIVIENAGAEKGVLIENKNDHLVIQAKGEIGQTEIETPLDLPIEQSDAVPISIINYVARTQIPIVLNDAVHDITYNADRYISERRVKSLLCLPIVHQARLSGLLYLENNLATNVFTHDRLELLRTLSSQAAISMENARLYANLEQKIDELKQAEELLKLNAERLTALLKVNQMSGATLEEITHFAFEEALRLTKSKIGYLAFVNNDETVMTMQLWTYGVMAECAIVDKPIDYPVEMTGLWGEAVRQRRPIVTNDYNAPHPWKKGYPNGHVKLLRHMNVPVIVGAKIVLVAGVGNKEEEYDETDVQQLTLLMEGMWRLIERNRDEEKIRQLNVELEQRVIERTAQFEAANKELGAFAYSVSHDLRAPLRHIDGFIGMLQGRTKTSLDDQSLHYMEMIADSARKMGTLIDNLLSFSRMGRNEMSKSQVDLDELVQDVIQEFKPETEGRDIQWKISPLPLVTGDQAMLRMALVNLIANALKFTRPREVAQIEIGCERKDETETVIFIRDNGVGFDMNYANKLFGVFQRLHRQEEFEGTGIGLANVHRVISRHGGRTWAEGQVDYGATFYFSLPCAGYLTHPPAFL